MVLLERAGELKPMLTNFALSPRFDREFSEVIWRSFPGGLVSDENMFTMVLDHFILQHRLSSGSTVVELFVAAHPELTDQEREMLLGWREVVEGVFEVAGRDAQALILLNLFDELTYRTRSNLSGHAFYSITAGMFLICRLIRTGEDWMVSGGVSAFPAEARDSLLVSAAKQAMSSPEQVFRNPEKLAVARRLLAEQHAQFLELHGTDLLVVAGSQISETIEEFFGHLARKARQEAVSHVPIDLPEEWLDAESVAIHFNKDEGLAFYLNFKWIEELFANPALVVRRPYREALSGHLRDEEISPEPLRRLADRDPSNAGQVFARLLKRRGFTWEKDGEALLRTYKASYFDGSRLPRTVPLSRTLSDALERDRR